MTWLIPPILLLACGVAMAILDHWWPIVSLEGAALPWAGGILIATGVVLSGAARMHFRRHRTTVWTFDRPSCLVTTGPFRLTRHPMYVGMMMALAGWALVLGSASTLVPWVVFAAACGLWYVPAEEAGMASSFGEAYDAYRRTTRRWL